MMRPADAFDHPVLARDPAMATACRHLWQAVLVAAIRDACGWGDGMTRNRGTKSVAARTARDWIGTRDFHAVCALAGLDGARVATRLRALVADVDAGRVVAQDFNLHRQYAAVAPGPGPGRVAA